MERSHPGRGVYQVAVSAKADWLLSVARERGTPSALATRGGREGKKEGTKEVKKEGADMHSSIGAFREEKAAGHAIDLRPSPQLCGRVRGAVYVYSRTLQAADRRNFPLSESPAALLSAPPRASRPPEHLCPPQLIAAFPTPTNGSE